MEASKENYNSERISIPTLFQEVFTHFYVAKNTSGETIVKTLLPSFQTILVFSFGSPISLHTRQQTQLLVETCLVLGPIKQAFDYSLPPNAEILVVNFKDDAFYRFFGNATVIENFPVHPDKLLDENCFTALWNELKTLSDVHQRTEYILAFCKPYLKERNTIGEQLSNFKHDNLNPIKQLASTQQLTERSIQLNHRKQLGYSAKELNRYRRFLKAIQQIQLIATHNTKPDWFELISDCGYYDQSQLIHDFQHYLKLSPTRYLKFQQDICCSVS